MIRFLRDVEIFKLLGKKDLEENNINGYLTLKLKPALVNAIKLSLEDIELAEEDLDQILNLIESNIDPEQLQVEAIKIMPHLLKNIESEVYQLKKNIILEQAGLVEQNLNVEIPEHKVFLVTISNLKDTLSNEDDMQFETIWNIFQEKRDSFL